MALDMRAALSLVLALVAAGHQGVCPNSTFPAMEAVARVSEACFKKCPQLCQPVSDLVKQYMEDGNHDALRLRVCMSPDHFNCVYKTENIQDCSKLLDAAHRIGLELPGSKAALVKQCAPNPEGQVDVCPGSSALLKAVTNVSVACFANCSQACKVMDHTVRDYMHNRTAHALVDRVCRHREELACFYKPENVKECSKVWDAAKQVGILVPKTLKELEGTCQEQAQDAVICPKARNPTLTSVTRLSPECFHLCPKVCQPMEQLVTEYVMHGNTAKLQDMVCKEERRFKCMYEVNNTRECGKVVKAATLLNITLPRTTHQLKEGCRAFREGKGGSESKAPSRGNVTENPGNKTNVSGPAMEASTPNVTVKMENDPGARIFAELGDVEMFAGVCSPGKTPLLHAVTDIAPPCIEACPNLCGSLDDILVQYTSGKVSDQESIQSQVCAQAAEFSCVFQGDNFPKCKKVLEASSAVGARVPLTQAEYRSACTTGLRGASDLPLNTIAARTPAPRLLQASVTSDKVLSSSAQAASVGIAAVTFIVAAMV